MATAEYRNAAMNPNNRFALDTGAADLEVAYRDIDALKSFDRNARTHSNK